MDLAIDCTLQKESNKQIYRISFINYQENEAFLFKCQSNLKKLKFPEFVKLDSLQSDLAKGKYVLLEDDPYSKGASTSLKDDQSSYFRKATIFFQHVSSEIMARGQEQLMYKNTRWKIIRRACQKANATDQSGLNWMKLLFNHGFSLNSLRPRYEHCGASSKARRSGLPKTIRKKITDCYLKFHLQVGMFLSDAWKNTKTEIIKLDEDAIKKYKITKSKFRYHGEKKYPKDERDRIRKGEINYNNNKRMLRGRATDDVDGPCYRYQIDSSVRDIQCVLSYDRNQFIGKPTFYVVSDTWCGAIIGVYITLDAPSYIAAAYALYIALTDKTELYKSLDLDLKHLTFNPRGIPFEIVADRAELLGPKSNNIMKICGIRTIGNTVAYSPTQKGTVERIIGLVQNRARANFLGRGQVLANDGERTAKDTQLEATVTLEELYKITLILVNEYNTSKVNSSYQLTEQMFVDEVDKIPAEIYRWGIKNNLGSERIKSAKELRFAFYEPEEKRDIAFSKKGVKIRGQEFIPINEEKSKELMRLASSNKKPDIVFNPVKYQECFWMQSGRMIPLRLRGKKDMLIKNKWEAIAVKDLSRKKDNEMKIRQEEVEIENDREIKAIIDGASEKQTKVQKKGARKAKTFQREIDKQKRYRTPTPQTQIKPRQTLHNQSKKTKSKWSAEMKKINK